MKKRIALLLALLMIFAILPNTALAATESITVNTLAVPANSILFETGVLEGIHMIKIDESKYDGTSFDEKADWIVEGTDLIIPFRSNVYAGYQFALSLSNAEWFFAQATKDGATFKTFNDANGTYDGSTKTYTRTSGKHLIQLGSAGYSEAEYKLQVSSLDPANAHVTISKDYQITDGLYGLRIPLVSVVKSDSADATVAINGGNASTISSQKLIFAVSSKSNTKAVVLEPQSDHDIFGGFTLAIHELRPGVIRQDETIKLTLPEGFYFVNIGDALAKSGVEPGLSGAALSINYGSTPYASNDKIPTITNVPAPVADWRTVVISFDKLNPSDGLAGALYLKGLQVRAYDWAPYGDINLAIEGSSGVSKESVKIGTRVDWGIKLEAGTPTKILSGRYVGPSNNVAGQTISDGIHKTARVSLKEGVANSWWATRKTVLALPVAESDQKGAKLRKVVIFSNGNVSGIGKDGNGITLYNNGKDNTAVSGSVVLNDTTIVLSGLQITSGKTAELYFDIWVSVEYGFGKQVGDLKLTLDRTSSSVTNGELGQSVVIAKVTDPIEVNTRTSDLKIGYQYQSTADIQIKETQAGALLEGKKVLVTITDYVSSSFYFSPGTQIKVTEGDLKIRNISVASSAGGFSSQSVSWLSKDDTTTMSFDIDKASTVPSVITISSVGTKLDRTVPLTNKESVKIVVWGTAVAENYGLRDNSGNTWHSGFDTPGEVLPYVNIVSSEAGNALQNEVEFIIGETFFSVNGRTFTMDVAPYISKASNSTLVPARYLGNSLGIPDTAIVFDDSTKTATFVTQSQVISFQLNNTRMTVNGAEVPMLSPDGLAVAAEIKDSRIFIPLRAFAVALGVTVDWEASTQTAIFNKGANGIG